MARHTSSRWQSISVADKTIWSLFALIAAACAALVFMTGDSTDEPTSRSSTAPIAPADRPVQQTTAPSDGAEAAPAQPADEKVAGTADEASGDTPPCSEVPATITEPVTCRTSSSVLYIARQSDPVLLGGTQARVIRATLRGETLSVRMRVRNETDAEQGVLAGGQELYLNLGGLRVDPEPLGDERVPRTEGRTVTLRFGLTPARESRLRAAQGRAELGIRPWTDPGTPADRVGVVRFQARLTAAAAAAPDAG